MGGINGNIPNKLRVGPLDYSVSVVTGLSAEHGAWGRCHSGTTRIEIDAGLSESARTDVFVHELVHAVFDAAGLANGDDEDTVNRLGKVLACVLRDNDFGFIYEKGADE